MTSPSPSRHTVLELLSNLIRINSVNPSYEGGVPEAAIVEYLQSYFERNSLETWQQEVFPGRPNLITRIPGRNPARKLVFEAHTDTVSIGGMTIPPFEPSISEGKMYGRGACDTKAGLAAMCFAAAALKQGNAVPPCDIWIVAAADEEFSFGGARRFLEGTEAAGAIIAEPTMMRIAIASKGVLRWRIHCRGKAAHSSKPHRGINAIEKMAHVIRLLEEENTKAQSISHPLLDASTLTVGVIQGGRQINMVPDLCTIEVDRRLLPGERISDVLARYRKILESSLNVEFEAPMLEDEALETPADSAIVQCATAVAKEIGTDAAPIGVSFGSDASKFSRAGIPSIICGPGNIDLAHSAVEYIELEQVELAVEFYRRLMLIFD
jgi:acetylornithine deacetylase/succinyl-diaminopimelate desuccinylase family protein